MPSQIEDPAPRPIAHRELAGQLWLLVGAFSAGLWLVAPPPPAAAAQPLHAPGPLERVAGLCMIVAVAAITVTIISGARTVRVLNLGLALAFLGLQMRAVPLAMLRGTPVLIALGAGAAVLSVALTLTSWRWLAVSQKRDVAG